MDKKKLQREISKRVHNKLFPLLEEYHLGTLELESVLKWKPVVLILGNYSSGKSTLVNEILGEDIQRTGQAPTDDSFTVLTAPNQNEQAGMVPGATLVNDELLPFTAFKAYGDQLVSHLLMKLIDYEVLENLAIIDTPGMLDSVTEKGRGYDFPAVVGEFAKLADLVVLMFDPHKAGTIKETYTTIRSTLPETSEEDRILFVMSRIDECDNLSDLIRSYGTLCWNLSQMTGRKDIPRIYLTFAPEVARDTNGLDIWMEERAQLKERIFSTPELKISHILHLVDKKLFELKMVIEAMERFGEGGRRLFNKTLKTGLGVGVVLFFLLDLFFFLVAGVPGNAFLPSLISGALTVPHLIIPLTGLVSAVICFSLWFIKWRWPRYQKQCRSHVDELVRLDSAMRENAWQRVKGNVLKLLSKPKVKDLYRHHHRNLEVLEKFSKEELKKYFSKIRKNRPSRGAARKSSTLEEAAEQGLEEESLS